jgi:hypothetical protein
MQDVQGEDPPSTMMMRYAASNKGGQNNNVTYANLLEQPCSCPSEHALEQPSGKSSSNLSGTMNEHNEKDVQGEDQSSVVMTRDAASNDKGGGTVMSCTPICWSDLV